MCSVYRKSKWESQMGHYSSGPPQQWSGSIDRSWHYYSNKGQHLKAATKGQGRIPEAKAQILTEAGNVLENRRVEFG